MDTRGERGCQAEDKSWLACGTPEAADSYRQCPAAQAIAEAKTQVWEEFGEAMEKDFLSRPKKFW